MKAEWLEKGANPRFLITNLEEKAAYILMLEIRQAAKGTKLEKAQVSRLRESLIKVASNLFSCFNYF